MMRLKLDNLVYQTENKIKIARLKELGAIEIKEVKEPEKKGAEETTKKK